ncbi:MAG: response regulator transcription factor [Oscillospiraceae bacterium]
MNRILIVEDDIMLSNGIAIALKQDTCELIQAFGIREAEIRLSESKVDLIILDINLPDGNGLEFLTAIRKTQSLPILLLTANDMETDIVTGLELGADDYITKPFSLAVLRARVNAQLRRAVDRPSEVYSVDGFSFHFGTMEYARNGIPVELSKTEQKLLRVLVDNRGRTLSRAQLMAYVWPDGPDYVDENALSVAVKRLRDKLEETPTRPKYIKTVYGVGYTWAVK